MSSEARMPRREFLAKGAKLTAAASAAPYLLAAPARAAGGRGELGLVGADHVGITVPDINQAIEWFEDVMGAVAPLTFGPFSDPTWDIHARPARCRPARGDRQITMLRIGHSGGIELFDYTAPDQLHTHPRNSDWAGHHIAFYVTDIETAVEYMQSKGVEKFLGPFPVTGGPAAGQSINYFRTPFGTFIELISYPQGMAYERDPSRPLWSPKRNGLSSEVTKVPGLLGIDHVGITVPNVAQASAWFQDVLGFSAPLTFGPFSDTGTFMHDLLDVNPRAVVEQITSVRGGNGPNVELFQYTAPGQDRTFRKNSDWGGKHIAFYVRTWTRRSRTCRRRRREAPRPARGDRRPCAGQSINYFRTPFGTFIELISYPKGMAYEATAPIPLWDPRDNRP